MFKIKHFISFNSFVSVFAFGLVGVAGCCKQKANNHDLNITLANSVTSTPPITPCLTPEWTYTDFAPSGFCINSNDYKGDSSSSFQVAGTCTSLWQNVTVPGAAQLKSYNILIDCATGSLFSSSFYTPVLNEGSVPAIAANNKASFTVTCSVYGQVRSKKTKSYVSTAACT